MKFVMFLVAMHLFLASMYFWLFLRGDGWQNAIFSGGWLFIVFLDYLGYRLRKNWSP